MDRVCIKLSGRSIGACRLNSISNEYYSLNSHSVRLDVPNCAERKSLLSNGREALMERRTMQPLGMALCSRKQIVTQITVRTGRQCGYYPLDSTLWPLVYNV